MARFVAGDFNGKRQMFVQNSTDNDKLSDPIGNISDFKFHSDFDNFVSIGNISGNVTFPKGNRVSYTVSSKKSSTVLYIPTVQTDTQFIGLNFNTYPSDFCVITRGDGGNIAASFPIQRVGNSFRLIDIYPSTSELIITSRCFLYEDDLPAITYNLSFTAFRLFSAITATDPGKLLRVEPGRVTFAEGRFDSNRRIMFKATSGGALFTDDRLLKTGLYSYVYRWIDAPSSDDRPRYLAASWKDGLGNSEKIGTITDVITPTIYRAGER